MASLSLPSMLARRAVAAPRFNRAVAPSSARAFHAGRRLAVYKETEPHDENRLEDIKRSHGKAKDGEWQDDLASDSESITKADRQELKGGEHTIEQLQQETAALANKKKLDELQQIKKEER